MMPINGWLKRMKVLSLLFLGLAALLGLGVWLIRSLATGARRPGGNGAFARMAERRTRAQSSRYCTYAVYSKKTVY